MKIGGTEGFLGWMKRQRQARKAKREVREGLRRWKREGHEVVWCPEEKFFHCLTCEEKTGVSPWIVERKSS